MVKLNLHKKKNKARETEQRYKDKTDPVFEYIVFRPIVIELYY